MTELDRIIDELQREFSGDPWHGSPLVQILDGISAGQAAAHPVEGGHSIWELVLHITAWKGEVRRRLTGAPASDPQEGDWPAVGDTAPERWWRALEALRAAHDRLVAAIGELPEEKLFEATNDPRNRPLGTGVSYYVLLHGIVQHDVYHSGQVAMLKRALVK